MLDSTVPFTIVCRLLLAQKKMVIGRSGTAMANTEHVERLKQGSTAWNAWRKENVSIVPDLSDADLPGADLRDSDLHGADLSDADLTGANLTGSDLHGADLSDVVLIGANLIGSDLHEA